MSVPQKLKGRYEIREILGQGGMGIVYRAFDNVVRRDIALKTLRNEPTRPALEMFFKECNVLAGLSHPNIVEIFDLGEYEEDGKSKPFFVMPLLPGATLDKLIKAASHRLTVERVVDIVCQTCRGLQAAHERGLIHRDMKSSNIFVLDDDSVKIIDFGVADLVEQGPSGGLKGTLLYMAPEQLQMKPATQASDIFSLGVVAYEALTRRRPFGGPNEMAIADAVLNLVPPAASDISPAVSEAIARAVHKAMAKQPHNRYANAREFAETLTKALRNEPIEFFKPARIQPRIERATAAFEAGDLQFASNILTELEAEGHTDPGMTTLRRQVELASRTRAVAQLMESARTRFEREEYPLALQKVEEILQLDAGNAQALGLKTSIENKLTAQKVEEWYRLARQHLDNQAFSHAREAVENVLQIRRGDARASLMLAEIDRRERDFLAIRKQKQDLYQAALEAWNSGEVSSALEKLERVIDLDRTSPDTTAPAQTDSYQQLYNKVRSEYESMRKSYAEARKLAGDHQFAGAAAIADEWLAKYPSHAHFKALKLDIDEQQRQEVSARIAAVDRDLDAEPDLERKVSMIEKAAAEFPGEAHFERQLKPLREKRDLVNSIAAKARWHEERGQFADALAQWEILKTIYPQYPGLEFEMDRVVKRRDQAAMLDAKTRWLEQIERAMAAFDYARAAELAASAAAEFPNDAEIDPLKARADEAVANIAEADKLVAQGRALCAQQWCDEGFEAMRRAVTLAPQHQPARVSLVEALLERARALLETDWRAAEPYVTEALELEPANAIAKSLRTSLADHRRDETVVKCFTLARAHRTAGRLDEALQEAERCFEQYPLDPRLQQLRDILKTEIEKARIAEQRPADLKALQAMQDALEASANPEEPRAALAQANEIAQRHPEDAEIRALVGAVAQRVNEISPPPPEPPVAAAAAASAEAADTPPLFADEPGPAMQGETDIPQPSGPQPPMADSGGTPPLFDDQLPPAPPQGQPPAGQPPAQQGPAQRLPAPPRGPRKPINRNVLWAAAGGAAVILLLVGVIALSRMSHGSGAAVVRLQVNTNPPGATVRVDGKVRGTSNFTLEVPSGAYQVDAALEGYQPASTKVNLAIGAPPLEFTLQPLAQTIRLFTDLPEGEVLLDDQPARDLQEGQAILDAVPEGTHTIKITSRSGEASFTVDVAAGRAPAITSGPVLKDLAALVVSNLGATAHVYSSLTPASVDVDGQPAGEAGPEGLQLLNLVPGTHEIAAGDGKTQLKKSVEISPAPTLTAFLQSDRNVGTLLVLTGEDGVEVYINGRRYRRQTSRGGQLRIPREPRQYRIRVTKSGFEEVPEQVVDLAKGEEKRLTFKLVPMPTTARLAFAGATPGTQVFLDGSAIGTVGSDGSFRAGGVPPGAHTIELRGNRMRSEPVRKSFTAGQTVELSSAEYALRATRGMLRLAITPANAHITVTRSSGGAVPVTGSTLELDAGSYTVIADAPGYVQHSQNVQISGGQTAQLNFALARERKPEPVVLGMEGWQTPWQKDGDWYSLKGAGMVLYKQAPSAGTYAFNILLGRGGGLFRGKDLEWFADYRDEKNYVLFRLEKTTLRRIVVENGKKTEYPKRAHNLDLKDEMMATVQVEVDDDLIVNRVKNGDHWTVVDSYVSRGGHMTSGRFGIHVIGNDEVRIAGFSFAPKQ